MAEQSGPDTEVERAGEAEGEQESVQPAKRVIWTPERLAKAAATRAETKRKKEEKEARKAAKRAPQADTDSQPTPDTPEEVLQPSRPPAVAKASAGNNGFDWDKAPLAEAINHLADMKREYDHVAQIVMRRQSTNKPSWVCWSQLHKDIVPVSVQKLCRKTGEDGKWAFRDDGVFKTENGIRMPDPVFCCNTYCFEVFQKSKPLMSLSRH